MILSSSSRRANAFCRRHISAPSVQDVTCRGRPSRGVGSIRLAGRFGWARSNTLHLMVTLSSENHEMRETTDPTILGWEGSRRVHEDNRNDDHTRDSARSGIRTEETSEGNLVDTPTAQGVERGIRTPPKYWTGL